ncbi:alpha/beta fold hydrolase [Rubricoccus marinus]|uniref:AB hydrolase-1 domain-containing protein n=1 Tax=Rubricoccus marinus TaxID=716817 RepID=A0A259TVR6_9BACT|nr:alpha/beta fold hydrolase [Rubricoccus marinus]OZC01674.1 hypothetical protein BSZ36_00960 [Rubricoccus marinus]
MPPTVLALHGFMGRGADWDPIAADLGPAAHILAPDLAGHGTQEAASGATLDREADRLAAMLDAPAILAGYSMGGRLALHLALKHPDLVRALVLVSASPGLRSPEAREARRDVDAERAAEIARDYPAFLNRWYRLPLWGELGEDLRQRLVLDRLGHNAPLALARSLRHMGTGEMAPLWDGLSRIRVPAWAVAGADDAKYVALADEMAREGPFRVRLVPGAGHALLAQAPHAIADVLRDALFP